MMENTHTHRVAMSFKKAHLDEKEKYWLIKLVKLLSCVRLFCDPMDCSLPGSSHGVFQARVLEWVAISFSRGSSPPRDRTRVSRIVDRCFTVWATVLNFLTDKMESRRPLRQTPQFYCTSDFSIPLLPCRDPGNHFEADRFCPLK